MTLGYALTIHKAQGVTVDHGIVIADDHLTAEALYVAMTRGRHDNTALVITDHLDPDGHDPEQPMSARDVLIVALARPVSEHAALKHLRDTFEQGESLAVLAPRLANLDAWITEHAPRDDTDRLRQVQLQLDRAVEHARPGWLTRFGREDRPLIDRLTDQRDQLTQTVEQRQAWFDEHADTLTYRQQLAGQVEERRFQLGVDAVEHEPAHLVELIGVCPDNRDRAERWTTKAVRIEAYREEWGINPDHLQDRPVDRMQAQQWDSSIGAALESQPLDRLLDAVRDLKQTSDLDRGLGMEL